MEQKFPPETRLACYPRVSTEEQKQRGLSIEDQAAALQAWADRNGIKNVTFYNDAGNSARKPYHKRPAMVRLLEDVRAGKIDLIIFTRLDRWFRNIAEYYKVQEILDEHGVSWKAIEEDYDTSTASGRLKINIMLSVAQDEADRDSERIRTVLAAKRERREPVSGHVPTGYRIEGKKIVKDPETERGVAAFFESFLASFSVERARAAAGEQGLAISYQLASAMLAKTAYFGLYSGVEGMCPAYITREQYEEIQAGRRRVERRTSGDRVYLFTGLVFCAECGRRFGSRAHMYAVKQGGRHECISYNCPGRYHHNDCENRVNIREAAIEEYLLHHVEGELERYSYELERLAAAGPPPRDFEGERKKIKKKLLRLKDLYVDDIIDLELYRKDYEALHAQLDELAAEEGRRPARTVDMGRLRGIFCEGWQEMYVQLDRRSKQAFWRLALSRITIRPDRKIAVAFRI